VGRREPSKKVVIKQKRKTGREKGPRCRKTAHKIKGIKIDPENFKKKRKKYPKSPSNKKEKGTRGPKE